jgi:hypothetical protein
VLIDAVPAGMEKVRGNRTIEKRDITAQKNWAGWILTYPAQP